MGHDSNEIEFSFSNRIYACVSACLDIEFYVIRPFVR